MCGRFSFSPNEIIIEERFDLEIEEGIYTPRYNCAPTQNLAVISNNDPYRLSFYRWGLVPFWAKDLSIGNKMINAKSETILEKSSFKAPFKRRRCLVPADGFYEWKKEKEGKVPVRILMKDESLFGMAGIWDTWKGEDGVLVNSFAIITTHPNELMESIHNRMPVIIHKENEDEWLRGDNINYLTEFLRPYPSEFMKAYAVSTLVNSPRNDTPEVLKNVE